MEINYSGMMIVGCYYNDLPLEVISEIEDNFGGNFYKWCGERGLDYASEWYDADEEGIFIGITVFDVKKDGLDLWFKNLKETFKKVESILKVTPTLTGTQDIY